MHRFQIFKHLKLRDILLIRFVNRRLYRRIVYKALEYINNDTIHGNIVIVADGGENILIPYLMSSGLALVI